MRLVVLGVVDHGSRDAHVGVQHNDHAACRHGQL